MQPNAGTLDLLLQNPDSLYRKRSDEKPHRLSHALAPHLRQRIGLAGFVREFIVDNLAC